MRRLHFDPAFDGGVWAGAAPATAGDSWLGPLGTLGALEGLLGLSARPVGAGVRVGQALRGLLEAPDGFWKASLEVDGLSTARELLQWADWLRLEGWAGEGGARLSALWAALEAVDPGPAERLRRVVERLERFSDVRFELELFADPRALPVVWQRALQAAASATATTTLAQPATAAEGLQSAQRAGFVPDTSERALQLLRPHGPLVAADVVAAALAASQHTPTVIIGSDPVLDAALRRYGVATTGAPQAPHDNVIGELLPLLVELGLSPADPQRALELLTMPGGLIHPRVARKLVHALQKWPAVGSPAWHEHLAAALAELDDDDARAKAATRVTRVFGGDVRAPAAYPTSVLLERVGFLQQWLHGRIETSARPEEQARYRAASSQAALFKNLVERTSEPTLSMTQVRRFLEEAHRGMATSPAFPRQAGVHAVASPGGVVGPISRVVWWNYTRTSAPAPRLPGLWAEERAALEAAGVRLPSSADLARQQAMQARRPFLRATESLWLVAPRHEANGDEATPHPSWDEVAARVKRSQLLERLVRSEPLLLSPVKTKVAAFIPIPAPVADWKTARPIERRAKESPSSVELLLGCSLQWALTYPARLRSGASARLPSGDQLLGSLAHHVLLERVLRSNGSTADALANEARRVFAAEGPALAAPLFLPGGTGERGIAEQVVAASARALFELVDRGWKVESTEAPILGEAFGAAFEGIPDLVVEKAGVRAIVDLKWSGGGYRRRSLEDGLAFQLAAYAQLLGQTGATKSEVAYFILTSQTLITASTGLAGSAGALKAVRTPTETWSLFDQAYRAGWARVATGALAAPGVVDEKATPKTAVDDEGALTLQPPCHYCDFTGICGRRYGRIEVEPS
ncbi:MAG: PD-(D/E)XK nuclease family protein [Myxococcus sp.]|nr:PD-(D/E)XK nuclease family protein [Myxococcus sp.]